jgi:hypothetical protein
LFHLAASGSRVRTLANRKLYCPRVGRHLFVPGILSRPLILD